MYTYHAKRRTGMRQTHEGGFTLIEMLVSLALFSIVLVIAVGSLVSLLDANRKARTQELITNNLAMGLETMSRAIREGSDYTISNGGRTLSFEARDGSAVVYSLDTGTNRIMRAVDGGAPIALTAADVTVTDLTFTQTTYGAGADEQPKILITLAASAGDDVTTASDYQLQTTVSKRFTFGSGTSGTGGTCSSPLVPSSSGSPGPAPVENNSTDKNCSGAACYLSTIIASAGYTISPAYDDQTETQRWVNDEACEVQLSLTFIRGHPIHADFKHVFGYYYDGDLNTFTPVFSDGAMTGACPSAQVATQGQTVEYTIPAETFTTLGFAICIESDSGEPRGFVATEAELNILPIPNKVAVFNPVDNTHVMAFEDIVIDHPDLDNDYNDHVVVIEAEGLGDTFGGPINAIFEPF